MEPIGRLSELIEDWKCFVERDGLKTSLTAIGSDVVRLPYRHLKFVVFARSLLDPFPIIEPKAQLHIRRLEHSDLNWIRQIDRPSEARLCAQRLAENHQGLIAIWDGYPAGYTWGSPDIHTRLERVHPKLIPGDFLCTDSYTYPDYRGRGIQTALTEARFLLFRHLGYRRAISYIEFGNSPSLAVWQRKFASQAIGTIDFMRIGAWYRVRYC